MAVGENGIVFSLLLMILSLNSVLVNDRIGLLSKKEYMDVSEFIIDCSNWKSMDVLMIDSVSYFTCVSLPGVFIGGNNPDQRCIKNLDRFYMRVNLKSIFFLCIMQSGDVHPHPGPEFCSTQNVNKRQRQPKCPCIICSRGVTFCSKAVSCDNCQRWTHIKCSGFITTQQYDNLVSRDSEFSFLCSGCTFLDLPFCTEDLNDDHISQDLARNCLLTQIQTIFSAFGGKDFTSYT